LFSRIKKQIRFRKDLRAICRRMQSF